MQGKSYRDNNSKLKLVFKYLRNSIIKLKAEKCQFLVSEVDLLGYHVNRNDIQPSPDKVL